LQQVDEKYVRTLHPYASNGRNSHRSKTHQQNIPSPYDKSDIKDPYSKESLGNKGNIFYGNNEIIHNLFYLTKKKPHNY
jgi:hypothetical protein